MKSKKNNGGTEEIINSLSFFCKQKKFIAKEIEKRKNNIDKYLLLVWLKKNNFTSFSQLILDSPKKFLP